MKRKEKYLKLYSKLRVFLTEMCLGNLFTTKLRLNKFNKVRSDMHEIIQLNRSQDSSVGSILALYRGGSGLKSRQGWEFFNENKGVDAVHES